MGKIKVLNLYAGIGGNRKLWGENLEVTAVELESKIAHIYKNNFPNDTVIEEDAHQYLLNRYQEFDIIWSSPPCPSHSRVRKANTIQNKPVFPEMKLYEEILFLQGYFKGAWCVENVRAWYKPLIEPQERALHWFWSNVQLPEISCSTRKHTGTVKELEEHKGFDLSNYKGIDKIKLLRNCVEPETGKIIMDELVKFVNNK